jgi:hypothetical protein
MLSGAIRDGSVSRLKAALKAGHGPVSETALGAAAEHGQVQCVRYLASVLLSRRKSPGQQKLQGPAGIELGTLPSGTGQRQSVEGVCDQLAQRGNWAALRTMVKGGCIQSMDSHTLYMAAMGGSKKCVRCGHLIVFSRIAIHSMVFEFTQI